MAMCCSLKRVLIAGPMFTGGDHGPQLPSSSSAPASVDALEDRGGGLVTPNDRSPLVHACMTKPAIRKMERLAMELMRPSKWTGERRQHCRGAWLRLRS